MFNQDQLICTRYYQKVVEKQGVSGICKRYQKSEETTPHIIAGCPKLASRGYICKHNEVATIIFQ